MTPTTTSQPVGTRAGLLPALLLLVALALPVSGAASPVAPSRAVPSPAGSGTVTTVRSETDGIEATLDSSHTIIPADGDFTFRAMVRATEGSDSLQVRFRLRHPGGRLIFQRTRMAVTTGGVWATESFQRSLSDIELKPGAYPVELEVSSDTGAELLLLSNLIVYDPKRAPAPVALFVNVSDTPLMDCEGVLETDPATRTSSREAVTRLASWVLSSPDARVALSIAPLVLEEWQALADGYEYTGTSGLVKVEEGSADARAFATALSRLSDALATGRLELTRQGYADPDVMRLVRVGLAADIGAHYAAGAPALRSSLETTASTGTVIAFSPASAPAVSQLASHGIEYVVASVAPAESEANTLATGAYRVSKSGPVILSADASASAAASDGRTGDLLAAIATCAVDDERADAPTIVVWDITSASDADRLVPTLTSLTTQPWLRLALGREVAHSSTSITLPPSQADGDTDLYWTDVAAARDWSRALDAALGSESPVAAEARRCSLVAQANAWDTGDVERGASYAHAAIRAGTETLGGVKASVRSVTLAGTAGDVPVTITNPTKLPLTLTLVISPSSEFRSVGEKVRQVTLAPRENYFEIPVDLRNSLRGELHIEVLAGDRVLARTDAAVRASYLDRIVIIAALVVALMVLLAFIVRRVRRMERTDVT